MINKNESPYAGNDKIKSARSFMLLMYAARKEKLNEYIDVAITKNAGAHTHIRGTPKTIEIHFLNKLSSRALAANFLFQCSIRPLFWNMCVFFYASTIQTFNLFFCVENEKWKEKNPHKHTRKKWHISYKFYIWNNKMMLVFGNLFILVSRSLFHPMRLYWYENRNRHVLSAEPENRLKISKNE